MSHFKVTTATCFSLIVTLLTTSSVMGQTSFQGVGDLPGSVFQSRALGVSADGTVVVGYSTSTSGAQAFRWTSEGGMVDLGNIPGGIIFLNEAYAVSGDGTVIVGNVYSASGIEAFRWTAGDGMVGLGDLPGDTFSSFGIAVSADGSIVVGQSRSDLGAEAFRWTEAGGMVGLGDLPDGSFSSTSMSISADGTVVVGSGKNLANRAEAFRWTTGGGIVGLGDIITSAATAISADGTVIVGNGPGPQGWEVGFRWTQSEGLVDLGDLPGGIIRSNPSAVSADGSVIVGFSESSAGREAFVWTETFGMRSVRDLLTVEHGLDLTDWELDRATGVSADGRTIVGWGTRTEGYSKLTEGWVATLASTCGDGIVNLGEECDDGNDHEGDSCLSTCKINSAPIPAGAPIPAASKWGLVVMGLSLLICGSVFSRRRLTINAGR